MILVFGSINIDLVAPVATIPRPGETVLAGAYETLFGGKGANQAVAAARIAGAGVVRMQGCVGDDAFGRLCRDNLASNGVVVEGISTDPAMPTGCAFIVVDKAGENAITVASGANAELTASALPATNELYPLVAIFQMEVPLAASLAVARAVKAAGGVVIWNLAPAPDSLNPAQLRDILATTDHLVVNELEALAACALLGLTSDDFEAAAARLAHEGATTCIVTAGSKGAFVFTGDGARFHAAALAIDPIDTTGAGDAFVGILAAGLHGGGDLASACTMACRGASLACLKLGAQAAMPDRDQLANASEASRQI
jgi:ribokinase